MTQNLSYEIQEGFSLINGILYLALTNSIGEEQNEHVILSFYINKEDYLHGYYQGFVNKSLDNFCIIQNNTLRNVSPIPNMYHHDPIFRTCLIEWTPNLINALSVYLFKDKDGTDAIVKNEIFFLLNKITGCVISN